MASSSSVATLAAAPTAKRSVSAKSDLSVAQFAADQRDMTRTWFRNLQNSGRNVEAHIAARKAAYVARWKEAGRYIGAGGRILDIGGGYLYEDLLNYIRGMDWDYWYVDVGEDETSHARELGQTFGYDPAHFSTRLNHELDYPESSFDAVFSSHCLEHSMDLKLTLQQLNLMLRIHGNLVVSVPFGWEPNPNHPYFFLEDEWLALIEDAGFRIRAYQIGAEYPESGQDLMVAAEKIGPCAASFRIEPDDFVKSGFAFHTFRDEAVSFAGVLIEKDDHVVLKGDWSVDIVLEPGVQEVLPVFHRHPWSGVVRVQCGADEAFGDLYRQSPVIQPLRLRLGEVSAVARTVKLTPVGRSDASFGSEAVLVGYMTR